MLVVGAAIVCSMRYFQLLTGKFCFSSSMHVRHLEPTAGFFRESLHAGRLPAWNPYCYFGMPQLPDSFPSNFYPLNLIFLIPNYGTACVAFLVLHQVIGVIAVCVASSQFGLRSVKSQVVPAVLYTAISICLCGDENLALAAVLAWLPFCVFGLMRCLGLALTESDVKPHPGGLIVVNSVFLGLMLAAGAHLVVFPVIAVFIVLLFVRLVQFKTKKAKQHHRPTVTLYLVSVILSASLASPVLLPTFEWASGPTMTSSVASPMQILDNLVSCCPNCSSIVCLFRGPETVSRETRDELAIKASRMMGSIKAIAPHQGRYLMMFSESERATAHNSDVCRSMLPNNNLRFHATSPVGFLGHPSNIYRELAVNALGSDPRLGYGFPPSDDDGEFKLLCFSRLTATVVVGYDWPDKVLKPTGFYKLPGFSNVFKTGAESWNIYNQMDATPVAYASDAWHWLKNSHEVNSVLGPTFNPLFQTLVEKPARIEIDEEKLDKIPLTEGNAPGGPPLTDSPKVDTPQLIKPVQVLTKEPEHISLSVKVDKPSFIVSNGSYYPGWKVYIDGVPAPCFRANGFARAAFVSAGSHAVTFDFRPDSLRVGGMLAVSTSIVLILLSFYWLWRLLGKTVRWMSYGKFE